MPGDAVSFDSVIDLSRAERDRLIASPHAPRLEDVVGFEFRGYNLQPATVLLGTRKFIKGFFGDPARRHAWGYNVRVRQNGRSEPWIARPSDDAPEPYAFFKVVPGAARPRALHPASLVVDYSGWKGYSSVNPVRNTVDYLVWPDPDNPDLIFGRSHWEAGSLRPFLGDFVLERRRATSYRGPGGFVDE